MAIPSDLQSPQHAGHAVLQAPSGSAHLHGERLAQWLPCCCGFRWFATFASDTRVSPQLQQAKHGRNLSAYCGGLRCESQSIRGLSDSLKKGTSQAAKDGACSGVRPSKPSYEQVGHRASAAQLKKCVETLKPALTSKLADAQLNSTKLKQ